MAKLQHVLFNVGLPPDDKINENTLPALVLAGSLATGLGLPGAVDYIKPLVVSQGKKKRSLIFQLAHKAGSAVFSPTSNSFRRSVSSSSPSSPSTSSSAPPNLTRHTSLSTSQLNPGSKPYSAHYDVNATSPDLSLPAYLNYRHDIYHNKIPTVQSTLEGNSNESEISILSPSYQVQLRNVNVLKSNYFYCETQFMDALHKISNKLSQVPKQARLSALRVEIAMLNKDLPAEVDIPLLLSNTVSSAASTRSLTSSSSTATTATTSSYPHDFHLGDLPKQNRLIRIVPSEAVLLNSAERVPYLLLIEYIRNDVDFNPASEKNRAILNQEVNRRHIFDTLSVPVLGDFQHSFSAPSSTRNSEDVNMFSTVTPQSRLSRQRTPSTWSLPSSSSSSKMSSSRDGNSRLARSEIVPKEESDMGDISVIDLFDDNKRTMSQLSASLSSLASLGSSYFSYGKNNNSSNGRNSSSNNNNGFTASPRSSDLSFSPAYMTPLQNFQNDEIDELAARMRTAAVMINQLESAGGAKLSKEEVERIKSRIISSMQSMEEHTVYQSNNMLGAAGERKLENDLIIAGIDDDSSDRAGSSGSTSSNNGGRLKRHSRNLSTASNNKTPLSLGEDWKAKKERIRRASPYGHFPGWDLFSCIVKTGSDLRQEAFACQLIQAMQMCWERNNTGVWVKRMRILITHNSAGLVETITNALSIHSIKKAMSTTLENSSSSAKSVIPSLKHYFETTFGAGTPQYEQAVDNFVRSLAAYSVICYLLQIKDRHNGNILLDNIGHIVHIDFGFLLSNSPGSVGFETSPFKLTHEYVDLMGGADSETFVLFKSLVRQAFKDIRKEAESIIILVEMMQRDSTLPCFASGTATAHQLRQRFQLQMSDSEVDSFVDHTLIQKSFGSFSTRLYDQYQLLTQGIYS